MSVDGSKMRENDAGSVQKPAAPVAASASTASALIFSSSGTINKVDIEKSMSELMKITEEFRIIANRHSDCITHYDMFQVVQAIKAMFDSFEKELNAPGTGSKSAASGSSSTILANAPFVFSAFRPIQKGTEENAGEGLVKIKGLEDNLKKIAGDFASLITSKMVGEVETRIQTFMRDALESKNKSEQTKVAAPS